jgi:hypothetical protein
MSTKVYDAYSYSGTPEELMQWLIEFRSLYEEVAIAELQPLFKTEEALFQRDADRYKNMSSRTLEKISNEKLFEDITNYFNTQRALEAFIDSQLNHHLNIDSSVVVYFYKSKTVVQFFGLDFGLRNYTKKLREEISSNNKFSDYSYWNNTDKPDKVSEEEWDEREKFYDDLTEQYHCFNSFGLVYELSNSETLLHICHTIAENRKKEKREK